MEFVTFDVMWGHIRISDVGASTPHQASQRVEKENTVGERQHQILKHCDIVAPRH
jgi:hypothetical protein